MASCILVSATGIKLVIPGGNAYQSALVEGASKLGIRRGLSDEAAAALADLVKSAATAINSASPKSVELLIDPGADLIEANLTALSATTTGDQAAYARFEKLARSNALSFEADHRAMTIGFTVSAHASRGNHE